MEEIKPSSNPPKSSELLVTVRPSCGTAHKHSKTRSASGALRRSRTRFQKLPKVLPSPTCGIRQTLQETSGPKTRWKMGTTAPLHGGTQPWSWAIQCVTLPVRSELVLTWRLPLCLSPRGPWGAACVGGSNAQHAHRCAGWHLAAGTSLLHTFSCSCPSLQGWDLPRGSGRPREFLCSTTVFVKCPQERIPLPEPLCPR